MLARKELLRLSRARLREAVALLAAGHPDGATYLCGYAVELALKARICRTLKWAGFPGNAKEFDGLQSFRSHNLPLLLRLAGQEHRITTQLLPEWSVVSEWTPAVRYQPVGSTTQAIAGAMIGAARAVMRQL